MFYKQPTLLRDKGFTLVEIVLVLFILAIIAALAIPATSGLVAQEHLKAEAKALEDYATSARKLAVTEGRSYEIVLDSRGFSLERVPVGEKKKEDVLGVVKFASSVKYLVQHWGKSEFAKPNGEAWIFRPEGICEPLRVHFESRDGWIEYTFNPLTARTKDESYRFP